AISPLEGEARFISEMTCNELADISVSYREGRTLSIVKNTGFVESNCGSSVFFWSIIRSKIVILRVPPASVFRCKQQYSLIFHKRDQTLYCPSPCRYLLSSFRQARMQRSQCRHLKELYQNTRFVFLLISHA